MRSCIVVFLVGLLQANGLAAVEPGPATITFVDGAQTRCEILFEHPNCPRLVVRAAGNATLQSLALAQIHQVTVGGKTVTLSPNRDLTDAEKKELAVNRLWGDETGPGQIGNYARQKWDPKPVMVWAKPGETADAMKPASWLDEHGEPFAQGPWKENAGGKGGEFDGDVLVPAAEQPYDASQPGNRDYLSPYRIRHLTVERNGSYNVRYTICGNGWIKEGSALGAGTQTGGMGSGTNNCHTFLRFCGSRRVDKKGGPPKDPEWSGISHWVGIDTGDKGSLEIIGASGGAGDRTTLDRGTLIISEDSYLGNGSRASFYSKEGTTTIMLDRSRLGCLGPDVRGRGTYGFGGTVMFGTPEHPLTCDLVFGGTPYPLEALKPTASPGQRTEGASFVLGPKGRMEIHSKDPAKARVVFCMRPPEGVPESKTRTGQTLPALTGVAAVFAGQTDFDGVVFDNFYKGGIVVSPDARAKWKNVSFGTANLAPADELFAAP